MHLYQFSGVSRLTSLALLLSYFLVLMGCGQAEPATITSTQHQDRQPAPHITPALSSLDATKQADDLQLEAQIATARTRPPLPTVTMPTRPSVLEPTKTLELGLRFDCDSIFTAAYILIELSCWHEVQNEHFFYIATGYKTKRRVADTDPLHGDDPSQGMLVFYIYNLHTDEEEMQGVFPTPNKDGALHIQTVNYPRVYGQTDKGISLIFNLETRQWETAVMP